MVYFRQHITYKILAPNSVGQSNDDIQFQTSYQSIS